MTETRAPSDVQRSAKKVIGVIQVLLTGDDKNRASALLLERGSRIGNCATVLYQTSRSMWTVSVPGTAAVSKRQDTVNESASDGVRKHVKFR